MRKWECGLRQAQRVKGGKKEGGTCNEWTFGPIGAFHLRSASLEGKNRELGLRTDVRRQATVACEMSLNKIRVVP